MKKRIKASVLIVALFSLVPGFAENRAEAQYSRQPQVRRATAMSMNADLNRANALRYFRGRRIGDLITVEINLNTQLDNQDQRLMRKNTQTTGSGAGSATGAPEVNAQYDTASNRQFQGDTQLRETRRLVDKFTVSVRDIDPRTGNLVIQGSRVVGVQGDARTIVLSGLIHPSDMNQNNSINAELVSNLSIRYQGKGPETRYSKEGWLMKTVSKIWPF
ncbi:MAG: flagellar basal body L-ring protein FlgH [Planctomycetota bacterium]|nr:flagellar basal body L-ring protein FlgH [Planctomycetota bacterium]